jgi:molybdopterin-guanine dinucleotide biosynthesis protein A
MISSMPHAGQQISAFILAGGKSTRMGTDKAFLQFNGRRLLERALTLTRSIAPNVVIIGAATKFAPFGSVVEDIFPGCGPLAGIHAALQSSRSELNLILAVDLPFVTPELLMFLRKKAVEATTALATVPRTVQGWQPLCAFYRREFADLAADSLRAGRYKIDALFNPAHTLAISEPELQAAGFAPDIFRNLNTPQDVAEASRGQIANQ